MACSENHRSLESLSLVGLDTHHLAFMNKEGIHAGLEMHLATTADDGAADVFYHLRQFVSTNMWMCIGENTR